MKGYDYKNYNVVRAAKCFLDREDHKNCLEIHDKAIVRAIYSKYKPPSDLKSNKRHVLFIGRLSPHTTEDTIKTFFQRYGQIESIKLIKDRKGVSRRYAFVEYKTRKETHRAHDRGHNEYIDGRKILIEYERSRNCKGWVPRRLGGGLGGDISSGQCRFGGRDCSFKKRKFRI
ncbi:U1 snRNP-binding protein [Intoshia linei]|uniref:U11/U12 small nuclear ribonucleoprotein 35 kDa protein n=1 Tax=Intoshia linei TaxID=1819745 RepID=A0A177BBK9_9BILA|nr:U1 snRNP-binding protein [Intoshia linei]